MTDDASSEKQYNIESNNSGAPKNFIIRCYKCGWSRLSSGLAIDLTDIHEVKSSCKNCGKARQFKCLNCGRNAEMRRVRGNH